MFRRFALLALLLCSATGGWWAQEIYLTTLDSRLYRLDLANCSYEQLTTIPQSTTDITFHPNGKLYALSSQGRLVELNPTNGMVTFVHQYSQNTFYTALTADADGNIYATGAPGLLSSYHPATGEEIYYGNIGFDAAGDLSFYDGDLYMASYSDDIILVDIDTPANSSVAIDGSVSGDIFGIVSYAANCSEVTTYALTNSNTDIYEINFATGTLDLYCSIPLNVGGGASTFEFFGSSPIEITELAYGDFQCASATGYIDITAAGGVGELRYSLDSTTFQADGLFTELAPGRFVAYVRDANGCTAIDSLVLDLEEPVNIDLDIRPATCSEDNGYLRVALVDPVAPPYAFALNDTPFGADDTFTGLSPGEYTLRVRDANGCERKDIVRIAATPPPVIDNISAADTRCGAANGSFSLVVSGGSAPLGYGLSPTAERVAPRFDSLAAGIYFAYVRDADNCRDSTQVNIAPSEAPRIVELLTDTATTCQPAGTAFLRVVATGGAGDYSYQLNESGSFSASPTYENLSPGPYAVRVRDANACISAPVTVEVRADPTPVLSVAEVTAAACGRENGSFRVTGGGGSGELLLTLSGRAIALAQPQTDLAAGAYPLVLSDARGCRDTLTVTIPAADCPIYLPSAFSPNNDGRNDTFRPLSAAEITGTVEEFCIYDRWGGALYRSTGLSLADSQLGWDGRARDLPVPPGTYLYVLVVRTQTGRVLRESGEFVLLR